MGEIKQQLVKIISEYYKTGNYSFHDIQDSDFRFKNNLNELWLQRENKGDDWDSFVKFVLFDQKEKQYISERIMRLHYESLDTIGKHFIISTDSGKFTLPDRLSEFLRLRSLHSDFFRIHRKIMSRINFNYPQREFSGNHISGKIDWNKTSRNSLGMFPIKFFTRSWVREFDTPENQLLLLCANWIKQDSAKILRTNFQEPLSVDEKDLLIKIHDSISDLITNFPFPDVAQQVRRLVILKKDALEITSLRSKVNKRIIEGKIKNKEYGNLRRWVGQYLDLSPEGIVDSKDMFVVESLTSIDKLYEILIFLEFHAYLKNEIRCNPRLELYDASHYKITFQIENTQVVFYHDKNFGEKDTKTPNWILTSRPDFSAMVDKKIVAVFDAKNYFRVDKKLKMKHTLYNNIQRGLRTLKKLQQGKELLFLKDYREFVGEDVVNKYLELLSSDKNLALSYCDDLINELKSNNKTMKDEYDIQNNSANALQKEATIKIMSYITNLDVNYGGLIFPKELTNTFTYPNTKIQTPRFHSNLMVEHMRLDYDEDNAQSSKDSTVKSIYDAIKFGINSQSTNPPMINLLEC